MNNKDFIAELSQRSGYSQDNTQRLVRIVVNPSTGQKMMVPPKLVLVFKPLAEVKQRLKKGGDL